jgi:hypothetical protein
MRCKQVLCVLGVVLVSMVLMVGCQNSHSQPCPDVRPVTFKPDTVDPWLVEVPRELSADLAVIRQHTIYPYHFVEYGAALNELGRYDLNILIRHYRQYPGPINVRRGGAPEALYQARVASVRDALVAGGVNVQQVAFADDPAGWDGLAGEHALIILQAPTQTSTQDRTVTVSPVTIQQGPTK